MIKVVLYVITEGSIFKVGRLLDFFGNVCFRFFVLGFLGWSFEVGY